MPHLPLTSYPLNVLTVFCAREHQQNNLMSAEFCVSELTSSSPWGKHGILGDLHVLTSRET